MAQSPILAFEASFPVEIGEDDATNPGIFGKALANWLAQQLRSEGLRTGDMTAEDFGWIIPIEGMQHACYIACARLEEGQWQTFVFAEGGFIARLLGNDRRAEIVADVFRAVKQILASAPDIRNVREEA